MTALYSSEDEERASDIQKTAPAEPFRNPWRRDLGRLLHCPSFRRLQAKTQVFPGNDSDFFRNRLTHSLEVAQIAKSIAIRINATHDFFKQSNRNISPDLVEFAALAHDLGHPPFGHNGEEALHEKMSDHGGFEGNAQTLHILARVEKKEMKPDAGPDRVPFDGGGNDMRLGLNLSYRSLASILKYDVCIPKKTTETTKGYYGSEKALVDEIKSKVLRSAKYDGDFKTIECSIMDIADDIAYSTYDLEDSFKAGLLTPFDLFSLPDDVVSKVIKTINKRLKKYGAAPDFKQSDLISYLTVIFEELFDVSEEEKEFMKTDSEPEFKKLHIALQVSELSKKIATDGFERVKCTSNLVQDFLDGIEVIPNEEIPQLSQVKLNIDTFKKVEVLKNITYEAVIMAPRMRVVEYRGYDIIKAIFEALAPEDKKRAEVGSLLLPDDYRELYRIANEQERRRIVCDFIAGMTDRYALQFFNRVCGSDPMTIYRPV